jgi:hypothetical protein
VSSQAFGQLRYPTSPEHSLPEADDAAVDAFTKIRQRSA